MSKNQVAFPANSRHSGPRRSHEEFVASTRKNRALNALEKVRNLGDEGVPGFDWTTSSNDMQRIRETSNLHRNESIAESFAAVYGEDKVFGSKKNMEHLQSITCVDLQPGDVVELRIVAITKKGVVFEQDTYKETIISTVNLHQFPNFKKFIPKDPVKVKVMSKDANNVYVDPLQPMLDDFIASININ